MRFYYHTYKEKIKHIKNGLERFKKSNLWILVIIAIAALYLGGITGFITNNRVLAERVQNLTMQLSSVQDEYEEIVLQYKQCMDDYTSKGKELEELSRNMKLLEDKILGLETEKQDIQKRYDDCFLNLTTSIEIKNTLQQLLDQLKEDYNLLANSSASVICCIQRTFNSTIEYYYIANNEIVCTDDSSKQKFEC